jgi:uncharacterized protein (DUF302 family)
MVVDHGLISKPGRYPLDETVQRLQDALRAKGVTIFALVDHSGEAAKVGMAMPPTKLLIFGNPRAGTPVMLAAPSAALDLPLKLLVREDAEGRVWISYNSAEYLRARHQIPDHLVPSLTLVDALVATVTV